MALRQAKAYPTGSIYSLLNASTASIRLHPSLSVNADVSPYSGWDSFLPVAFLLLAPPLQADVLRTDIENDLGEESRQQDQE